MIGNTEPGTAVFRTAVTNKPSLFSRLLNRYFYKLRLYQRRVLQRNHIQAAV